MVPVLLSVVRTSDDALRLYLLKSLTELVSVLRQHVRKYLVDLLALVHHYWASHSKLLPVLLTLISEIAGMQSHHTTTLQQHMLLRLNRACCYVLPHPIHQVLIPSAGLGT